MRIKKTTTEDLEIDTTPELLGKIFANLSDDDQARFFVGAAEEAKAWGSDWYWQFWHAGSHLKNCNCSTEDGRELVRALHRGLVEGNH